MEIRIVTGKQTGYRPISEPHNVIYNVFNLRGVVTSDGEAYAAITQTSQLDTTAKKTLFFTQAGLELTQKVVAEIDQPEGQIVIETDTRMVAREPEIKRIAEETVIRREVFAEKRPKLIELLKRASTLITEHKADPSLHIPQDVYTYRRRLALALVG